MFTITGNGNGVVEFNNCLFQNEFECESMILNHSSLQIKFINCLFENNNIKNKGNIIESHRGKLIVDRA